MSATPNRARFLLESLADLRAGLRARGGDLAVRHGRPEAAVIRLATQTGAREMQWRRPLAAPQAARLPGRGRAAGPTRDGQSCATSGVAASGLARELNRLLA
jgi:DNA photolyase